MDDEQKIPGNAAQAKKENFFYDIIKFALIAIIIIVPIRTFIAEPFIVFGASMDQTFANGEYLIVDQVSYHFEKPSRGDVVIFRYPRNPKLYFIKRVIGLPGETVTSDNGTVTITPVSGDTSKNFILSEPFVSEASKSYDSFTETLGPTEYFVMGDNRNQSSDSRAWGPLDMSYMLGRPIIRLFPPSIFPG